MGNNSRSNSQPGCVGADGRYLYMGNDHKGTIDRYDLSTRAGAGSVQFQPGINRTTATVACDRVSDTIVAVIGDGRRSNSPNHTLVKLAPDLTTLWSLPFVLNKTQGVHFGSISPGGQYFAVAMYSRIALFDLFAQEQIDADPSTPEIDAFETGVTDRGLRFVRWSQDGNSLIGKTWWNNGLLLIAMPNGVAGGGFVSTAYGMDQCCTRSGDLAEGTDGRIWVASDAGLWVYDPATDTYTNAPYGQPCRGVEFIDGELYVMRSASNTVDIVDDTGAIDRTITLNGTSRRHDLISTKTDD